MRSIKKLVKYARKLPAHFPGLLAALGLPIFTLVLASSASGADTKPPVIVKHADEIREATTPAGAAVTYYPSIVSDDSGVLPTVVYSKKSGAVFPLGATTVHVSAYDATGNYAASTFTVTVLDRTKPVVRQHYPVKVEATSAFGANVFYLPGMATDAATADPVLMYSNPSGSLFPIGETIVTITVIDASGNVGVGTFTVTVEDSKPPEIAPHVDVFAEATSSAGALVTYQPATVTDVSGTIIPLKYSQVSGTVFPIGETTVTITAIDTSRHQASSRFTVTVADTKPPTILPLPNLVLQATSPTGAIANYPAPTVDDAVDHAPVVSVEPASGTVFPVGIRTVQITATDSTGNKGLGSFTVTVNPPVMPGLTVSYPRADQTVAATGEISLHGRATDVLGIDRVEVALNGAAPQVIRPPASATDFDWTLPAMPESGANHAVVTAFNSLGFASQPVSFAFNFIHNRPELAGTYNGLLRATAASSTAIDHEGVVSVQVLSSGAFTGKVILSGTTFPLRGIFLKDGRARFATNVASVHLVKKKARFQVPLGEIELTLDTASGADRMTGTLTLKTAVVALLDHADRALYTAKNNPAAPFRNVPAALLGLHGEKGRYDVQIQGAAEGVFPPGEGWTKVSVGANGTARLVGKLSDGSPVSCANTLSKINELPLFAMLYAKKGVFIGTLALDSTKAAGVKWYKNSNASGKLYPAGWPQGVTLDLVSKDL